MGIPGLKLRADIDIQHYISGMKCREIVSLEKWRFWQLLEWVGFPGCTILPNGVKATSRFASNCL